MSREIKMDGPLSEEDRRYLLERGREDQVTRMDEMYGNGEETEEAGMASEETYEDWTVPQLQAELERRDLDPKGKKQELIDRLEADDEEASE